MFDDNKTELSFKTPESQRFFSYIGKSLGSLFFLKIAKLHDPSSQYGRDNLSINYIIEQGNWQPETEKRLLNIKARLDAFYTKIKPARNRIISHNDLATNLEGLSLGQFEDGEDAQYFEALYEFIELTFQEALGSDAIPFYGAVDAKAFLAEISENKK